jgi:hypothetical protein
MPSAWEKATQAAVRTARQADESAIHAVYRAITVSVEGTRERLRGRGWLFLDPACAAPTSVDVRFTAERVVTKSVAKATAVAGFAGLGGILSVPPEVAAEVVALVRLAQRLAIVYGLDPTTDRGERAVHQALSAGLEIELPAGGLLGMRVSDLSRVFVGRSPKRVSAAVTGALVRQTTWMVAGRVGRFVPGLSAGFGAVRSRRRIREVGTRMVEVFERLSDLPIDGSAGWVDAEEVRRS